MTKKSKTFEQSLHELEQIVQEIERGEIGLEDSIKKYEQGMILLRQCRTILSDAEFKIQKLQEADGQLDAQDVVIDTGDPS